MKDASEFEKLRHCLTDIDAKIISLVAERQKTVSKIGHIKRGGGLALRDFKREKVVVDNALHQGQKLGLNPELTETIMRTLIAHSLSNQEKDRISGSSLGSGKRILIIGGSGKMGRWFSEFFRSQNFRVDVADCSAVAADADFACWQDAGLDYDIIVVATPIAVTARILDELAAAKPTGLVFDIGSLKSPLRKGITALRNAGCNVASIHPMFSPTTQLLTGCHLIFVDTGCEEAKIAAKELFEETMVEQIDMHLDEHDHLIAFVLGLSHAVNIAFFDALGCSGEKASKLIKLSSSTFDAQLLLAAAVARENPNLYFEIQFLNKYGINALDSLCDSMDKIRDVVKRGARDEFVEIMQRGHEYLAARRKNTDGEGDSEYGGNDRRRNSKIKERA